MEFFAKSGSLCNAYTTFRNTSYLFYATKDLKENIEYLLNYVQNIYLTEEDVEKEEEDEENKKYLHRERKSYSKVSRSFYLGDIDEEDIDASFKNGILVVSAPKKKEIETKKTISIKDSE
jgi:HSP20 family protein